MKITDYLVYIIILISVISFNPGSPVAELVDSKSERDAQYVSDEKIQFAVISDMNKSYGSTRYLSELTDSIQYIIDSHNNGSPIDFVLSTGDMVAGQKKNLNYRAMWDSFHRHVTVPLNNNNIGFAPSPGNHDSSIARKFKKERQEYQRTFTNRPKSILLDKVHFVKGSNFPLYYAFTFKNALFISLDATGAGPLASQQMTWIEHVLSQNQYAKLKIVFGHMPLYPFAFKRTSDYLGFSSPQFSLNLEGILEYYNVDVFLSGHHHVYYNGHRNGRVKYVSVPLLGTGKRSLLTDESYISKRGFLLFEYSPADGLSMKAIRSKNMAEIDDNELPNHIKLPKSNSIVCKGCAHFPNELFIPQSDRILYLKNQIEYLTQVSHPLNGVSSDKLSVKASK